MSNAFTSGRIHLMQRTLCFVSVPSSVLSHSPPPPFFFSHSALLPKMVPF